MAIIRVQSIGIAVRACRITQHEIKGGLIYGDADSWNS
jgi:hypothetical protein